MSVSGHLLRKVGFGHYASHIIHCGAVSIEKDKQLTPAQSSNVTRSSDSTQYMYFRFQTYSDALKIFFLFLLNYSMLDLLSACYCQT